MRTLWIVMTFRYCRIIFRALRRQRRNRDQRRRWKRHEPFEDGLHFMDGM
jgi:hypothetical protein